MSCVEVGEDPIQGDMLLVELCFSTLISLEKSFSSFIIFQREN